MVQHSRSKLLVKKKSNRNPHAQASAVDWRSSQIEVVLNHEFDVPFCSHGPCLLFERYKNTGEVDRFFACAVFRDRKGCSFYRRLGEKRRDSAAGGADVESAIGAFRKFNHKEVYKKLRQIKASPAAGRHFCQTCSELVAGERKRFHDDGHEIDRGVTNRQLRKPSRLLPHFANEKREAQYWFSERTLATLTETITGGVDGTSDFDGVLCVGTPRLFEALRPYRKRLGGFLLDVDARYKQFWSPKLFAQYSMFVDHFYSKLGEKATLLFMGKTKRLLVVVDPPFGGMIAPLAQTMGALKQRHQQQAAIERDPAEVVTEFMCILPYFYEKHIARCIPDLKLINYRVEYENHKIFSKPAKLSNPVRIFTTLKPSEFKLPLEDYKFCEECDCFVFENAVHCKACRTCASKDGKPSNHCAVCDRCVKASYKHCKKCKRCHLPQTKCKSAPCCIMCGSEEHKKTDCPKRPKLEES